MNTKQTKWDKWLVGWITGMILPIFGVFILYLTYKTVSNFKNYIVLSYKLGVLSNILAVALLANLTGFYFFLNKQWYYSVRGIMLAVLTWGAIILILRLTIPKM